MTYAAKGNRATAARIIKAENDFVSSLRSIAGISEEQAVKVMRFYLGKCRAAKLDAVIGKISVRHGAFLDREVILRAAEAA